jgi:hypothetical protein
MLFAKIKKECDNDRQNNNKADPKREGGEESKVLLQTFSFMPRQPTIIDL